MSDAEPNPSDPADGERRIPADTTVGRRTPTFTAESVPAGLLGAHRTNAWAELVVLDGSVDFHQHDPAWRDTATTDRPVVIVPRLDHHIEPAPDARFYVQFYDDPESDAGP